MRGMSAKVEMKENLRMRTISCRKKKDWQEEISVFGHRFMFYRCLFLLME
jgi:hypothetical protein